MIEGHSCRWRMPCTGASLLPSACGRTWAEPFFLSGFLAMEGLPVLFAVCFGSAIIPADYDFVSMVGVPKGTGFVRRKGI